MEKTFRYDDVPPVQTKAGRLQGYFYDGVYKFKGVPYAQAKRFHMPTPVDPWDGVKDACSYGPVCPLTSPDKPTGELLVPHRYWPQDENCHNLNIWTNTLDPAAKKPVLVWLHGGGYTMGSAIEQEAYDGAALCAFGDVVVVSVNHRLNILGHMDLSEYGEEYALSGTLGLADLVAALEWVRDNIRAFGGDAGNVTIFGQSGGGMKVTGLMQIPAADGLFHKAVVMSGVSDGKLMPSPKKGDTCTRLANTMAKVLGGKSRFSFGRGDIKQLESAPYHDLARAYNKVFLPILMTGGNTAMAPAPNDYYLGEPLLAGFTEHAKTVPLMVGTVFGEFAFAPAAYDKNTLSENQILEKVEAEYKKSAKEALALFAKAFPGKHPIDLLSLDRVFRIPSKALAKQHAAGGKAPAWLYEFALNFNYQHGKPAWHCSDIPFFFHTTGRVESSSVPGVTGALEEAMCGALARFARTGDPNGGALPSWQQVTEDAEPTMIFDANCRVANNFDDELLALADRVLPKINLMSMMKQNVQH